MNDACTSCANWETRHTFRGYIGITGFILGLYRDCRVYVGVI